MAKKNYYAVYYKGEGSIYDSWYDCEKFMHKNKGPKHMKGFTWKSDAQNWLKTVFGEDEPIDVKEKSFCPHCGRVL